MGTSLFSLNDIYFEMGFRNRLLNLSL